MGLQRTSFWADLMIVNNNDIVEAFLDNKVLVNVDPTDATNMVIKSDYNIKKIIQSNNHHTVAMALLVKKRD
jgi:hypothetical protein